MRAFQTDLRQRVLDAALRGDDAEQQVADRFGVSRGDQAALASRRHR
ncbi:hypothetical protein [Rubrivirga sp.]